MFRKHTKIFRKRGIMSAIHGENKNGKSNIGMPKC